MKRRYFPSILLYAFGLALALSLTYNGFLLYEQSRLKSMTDYGLGSALPPIDPINWQQQLSDCEHANQLKDSLIRQLEQAPNAPPTVIDTSQQTTSKAR